MEHQESKKFRTFSPLSIQPFSAMVKLMEGESALMKGAKKKKKIEYLLNQEKNGLGWS